MTDQLELERLQEALWEAKVEIKRLREALQDIADIPNGNTYFGQLQECAKIAKEALKDGDV